MIRISTTFTHNYSFSNSHKRRQINITLCLPVTSLVTVIGTPTDKVAEWESYLDHFALNKTLERGDRMPTPRNMKKVINHFFCTIFNLIIPKRLIIELSYLVLSKRAYSKIISVSPTRDSTISIMGALRRKSLSI